MYIFVIPTFWNLLKIQLLELTLKFVCEYAISLELLHKGSIAGSRISPKEQIKKV